MNLRHLLAISLYCVQVWWWWSIVGANGEKFKIGSLLPDLIYDNDNNNINDYDSNYFKWMQATQHQLPTHSNIYNNNNNRNNKNNNNFTNIGGRDSRADNDVSKAVRFATTRLSEYFLSKYGCEIGLDSADTKCEVSHGTRSYFELAKKNRQTLALFGGSCDTTIKPIAESVPFFNLTLLSYTETDPTFSDQAKYYGFFRMVPSEEQHNPLRLHVIRKFNWTRVGTIYLTKAKFTLAHNMLIRELDKITNFTVSRSILENQNQHQYETILKEFISNDIKIIIGIFDVKTTLRLFCEVFKRDMYGESYQWIILGTYNKEMLTDDLGDQLANINCTIDQILIALNGTLQTRVVQYSHDYETQINLNRPIYNYLKVKDHHNHQTKSSASASSTSSSSSSSSSSPASNKQITGQNKAEQSSLSLRSIGKSDLDLKIDEITASYVEYLRRENEMKQKLKYPSTSPYSSTSKTQLYLDTYFHGYAFDVILAIFKLLANLVESKKFDCKTNTFERNTEWFSLFTEAFNSLKFKGLTVNSIFIHIYILYSYFLKNNFDECIHCFTTY